VTQTDYSNHKRVQFIIFVNPQPYNYEKTLQTLYNLYPHGSL